MTAQPMPGECITSERWPHCWQGCDDHGWQHTPGRWQPGDDEIDDEGCVS
jgi:hypothetical protein